MDDSFIKPPSMEMMTSRFAGAEKALQKSEPSSEKEIKDASKDFEALLVQQMLASWWKTVPSGGGISNSREEELFRDMLNQELAQQIAENDSLGIKDTIAREMTEKSKGKEKLTQEE